MRIGVLTSSRADYGIYLPLLLKLKVDPFFELEIIAFGTHLSKFHGFTITEIEQNEYNTVHKISSLLSNDDEQSIATSYGLTAVKFADFWQSNKYDLVFCLGDRFEMSAAVQAGIPFGIKFAHIHGGETTLGAIDNVYRHQITHASILHFTACERFREKVIQLTGISNNVHTIGSLSLEGIEDFKPISKKLFYSRFNIPDRDFALITFHPETIDPYFNLTAAVEMRNTLKELANNLFLVITMPNADTMGSIYRKELEFIKKEFPKQVLCVESFGKVNYFNAMYYSKIIIGNTSSGILEAASFGKYVVNVGNRQKGRAQSDNVFNSPFSKNEIMVALQKALAKGSYNGINIYYKHDSVGLIINHIKKFYEII